MKNLIDRLLGPRGSAGNGEAKTIEGMAAEPDAIVVLIAEGGGFAERALPARLAALLAERPGLLVRPAGRRLRQPAGVPLLERLAAAGATARAWLAAAGAQVLIWGDAVDAEGAVTLHFVTAVPDAEAGPGWFGPGDALALPAEPGREVAEVLHAAILAAAVPAAGERKEALAHHLAAALGRAERWAETPPGDLGETVVLSLRLVLGNSLAALWRLNGEAAPLEKAAKTYRLALEICRRDEAPLLWALLQNHLARVLEVLGGVKVDAGFLEDAARAYLAVTTTLSRDEHSQDWAFAQARLGSVLYRLAAHRAGSEGALKGAVAAFEAALQVMTRDAMPAQWAEVSNQLGVSLMDLGAQSGDGEILERAAETFREILQVCRRERTPLLWAQVANNLGAATFALHRYRRDRALLEEAVVCFEGAREVYAHCGQRRTVAVIERNLIKVRRSMRA